MRKYTKNQFLGAKNGYAQINLRLQLLQSQGKSMKHTSGILWGYGERRGYDPRGTADRPPCLDVHRVCPASRQVIERRSTQMTIYRFARPAPCKSTITNSVLNLGRTSIREWRNRRSIKGEPDFDVIDPIAVGRPHCRIPCLGFESSIRIR